jgi:hypothetical protein
MRSSTVSAGDEPRNPSLRGGVGGSLKGEARVGTVCWAHLLTYTSAALFWQHAQLGKSVDALLHRYIRTPVSAHRLPDQPESFVLRPPHISYPLNQRVSLSPAHTRPGSSPEFSICLSTLGLTEVGSPPSRISNHRRFRFRTLKPGDLGCPKRERLHLPWLFRRVVPESALRLVPFAHAAVVRSYNMSNSSQTH